MNFGQFRRKSSFELKTEPKKIYIKIEIDQKEYIEENC